MVLSELTNKELKGILRENDVRNYSKMNKKGLLKKVNQLIKEQNGGKSKKKYRLRGGSPQKKGNQGATTPATAVSYDILNNNTKEKDSTATANAPGTPANAATANAPGTHGTPATTTDVEELSAINSDKRETPIASEASALPLENHNPSDALKKPPQEKLKYMKNDSINPINTVQVPNPYRNTKNNSTRISTSNNNNNNKNKPKDECGACTIL
jgi:hypothetical protein